MTTTISQILSTGELKQLNELVQDSRGNESPRQFATRWVGNLAQRIVELEQKLEPGSDQVQLLAEMHKLHGALEHQMLNTSTSYQQIAGEARAACDKIREALGKRAARPSGHQQTVVTHHRRPTMSGPKPEARARKAERSLRDQQLRSSMKGTGGGGAPRIGSGAKPKKR